MDTRFKIRVLEILQIKPPEEDFWTEKQLFLKLKEEFDFSNKQGQEILQNLLGQEIINCFSISREVSYFFGFLKRAEKVRCYSLK